MTLRCREFIERLIVVIVGNVSNTSDVSKSLRCFCPELKLEGNNHAAFSPVFGLCLIFVTSSVVSVDESKSAQEEYTSYVIEKRRHHAESAQAASEIHHVMDFLLRNYGFQARHRLLRVFKLCCFVVKVSDVRRPLVKIDLSGSAGSPDVFRNSVELVQSCTLRVGYTLQSLFTAQTLD